MTDDPSFIPHKFPSMSKSEVLQRIRAGKVIDVDRVSSTLGGDVVYTVTIELDTQPQGLLWGMSADVQIETAE